MVSQHPGVQRCSGGFPSHQTDLREDAVWRELAPEGGRVWYQVSSVPTKGLPHLTLCSDTPSFAAGQPEAATLEGRGVGVVQGGRGWVVSAHFSALGTRKTQKHRPNAEPGLTQHQDDNGDKLAMSPLGLTSLTVQELGLSGLGSQVDFPPYPDVSRMGWVR